tara:strand:- start:368 stop:508 length:141 start_codon:yes stop_codon:yes gene_type:complete
MLILIKAIGMLVGLSLIGGVIGTGISLWSEKRKRKKELNNKEKDKK